MHLHRSTTRSFPRPDPLQVAPRLRVEKKPSVVFRALLPVIFAVFVLVGTSGWAETDRSGSFNASQLKGSWVFSGLLQVGLPVPFPGTLVDGAPPHSAVNPGDVVGVWASILGSMTFDGAGNVPRAEDVIKIGGLKPLSPPVPFDFLPPFPEVYTGTYAVSSSGTVQIALTGRDAASPEGQVDFEFDLQCVILHRAQKMQCVPARFRTSVVDPGGYPAPITGTITVEKQH